MSAQPDLVRSLGDLARYLPFLEVVENDGRTEGVRIPQGAGHRTLLSPDAAPALLEGQCRTLAEAPRKGSRFLVLAGIGAGHALASVRNLLQEHSRCAAGVCESDPIAWAAFFSLFSAQEILSHPRIYLYGGPDAAAKLAERIQREYLFLLTPQQISYVLGAVPTKPSEAEVYISQAKAVAAQTQNRFSTFTDAMDRFEQQTASPIRGRPRSAWCSVHRDAYIHFPIAEAMLEGFARNGLETRLEPFDNGWNKARGIAGRFIEIPPDLVLTLNAWPSLLLEDLGLARETVASYHRPRVCWLVDNAYLYDDNPLPCLPSLDYVACCDRSFLSWVSPLTPNAAFLPIAATLPGPGKPREEYAAPLSYVGSLPNLAQYLSFLPSAVPEMLQMLERRHQEDYSRSFAEHWQMLDPTQNQHNSLLDAARRFGATTGKELRTERALLEYFLYNTATYFKRKNLVEALLPLGLRVYGPDSWRGVLPARYQDRFGGFVAAKDLADVYASSQINLNIHSHQCPTCLNVRDFDVPMAGGAVMGDYVSDMDTGLLQPGKELLMFRSIEEAAQTTETWLQQPDALQAVRTQGQARVMREHTFTQRAEAVLGMVE